MTTPHAKYEALMTQWNSETKYWSSIARMEREPGQLTDVKPEIKEEHVGRMREVVNAYLKWVDENLDLKECT